MSISTESQGKAERNTQAIASLILGVLSIVLALMTIIPGILSALGCVAPVAALLAFVAGVRGIRAARELDGQGRKLVIAGMAIGGLGLLVSIVLWTSAIRSQQRRIEALLTPQPAQTFQGDGFTLTYPGGWQTLDVGQQDVCRQPGVECLFAINHPSGDGTNISLIRFALEQELTVEEADEVLWAQFESSTPDVILESREAIEIGGQSAIKRVFSAPSSAASGGRVHMLQIYIVKGLTLFQFTGLAPRVEALKQHQAEIEEIVTSIQFTTTATPAASPTPSASGHMALGNAYYDQGKLDEAIAEYKEAIRLNPDLAEAHHRLGNAHYDQGKLDEAIAEYKEAIRLNPDDAKAHYNLGFAYKDQGKLDEAIAEWEETIRINPDHAAAHNNLASAYGEQGRVDEAIVEHKEAIRLNPDDAMAHYNLGVTYASQGKFDEAIAEYKEAIRINPDYANAHINLGNTYAKQGKFDEAIAEFETYLRLWPDAPDRVAVEEWIAEHKGQSGQVYFDGFWQGTTSQGEEIVFLVAENGIAAIQVSFEIPGCETESPMAITYGGQPEHFITGNTFSFTEPGLVNLTITGTFSSSTRAYGTLEISCKDDLNATTWTASWSDSLATPTPRPEFAARIPAMKIKDDLFFRDAGESNFDINSLILYSRGDWFLVRSASTRSMLPIPGGWTTEETGGDTWILFSPDGDIEYPTIQIRLGSSGYEGDTKTSQEVITEFEESASGNPDLEILKKEIVDTEKGYIFLGVVTETGRKRYLLLLCSREPLSEDGESGGWFHTFSAFIYEEDWDDYYPIIQAMVEHWYGLYDNPLGVTLPDTLLE